MFHSVIPAMSHSVIPAMSHSVIPAQAGIQFRTMRALGYRWIPACAGMTGGGSSFCILHFAFCILHSAFCILRFAFPTQPYRVSSTMLNRIDSSNPASKTTTHTHASFRGAVGTRSLAVGDETVVPELARFCKTA